MQPPIPICLITYSWPNTYINDNHKRMNMGFRVSRAHLYLIICYLIRYLTLKILSLFFLPFSSECCHSNMLVEFIDILSGVCSNSMQIRNWKFESVIVGSHDLYLLKVALFWTQKHSSRNVVNRTFRNPYLCLTSICLLKDYSMTTS